MVEGDEAAEDFFARGWADDAADSVVFWQHFQFAEVKFKLEVLSGKGIAHGFVKFPMQPA